MMRSPSATADSNLDPGGSCSRPPSSSPGCASPCGRRRAPPRRARASARGRDRPARRSITRASFRTLSSIASGFFGRGGKRQLQRRRSPALRWRVRPPSEATSARAPARTSAFATSSVVRSSPPASSRGTICKIVRPASGRSPARPNGASAPTLISTRSLAAPVGTIDETGKSAPSRGRREPEGASRIMRTI